MLTQGFGPGFAGPLEVVGLASDPAQVATVNQVVAALRHQPGVASVSDPALVPARGGTMILITVYPTTSPQAAATSDVLHRLRHVVIPDATGHGGPTLYVTGTTAIFDDFAHVLSAKLPVFIGGIVGLSFIVLAAVFRSLIVPLTAAVMNILAIAAAFGVLVAVFQWGWLGPALGAGPAGPVESFLPAILFPILFGLSMDYQVFLLARIHENWARTRDNKTAVRDGLTATGRTITAAALIMITVFAAFALGDLRFIKEFGLGLAAAVLIDAVIIRTAFVPALMLLLGKANWWFPHWLDHAMPRIRVEPTTQSPETS